MLSKLVSWFDKDDYKFRASIGNEKLRSKLLAGLYKARIMSFLGGIFFSLFFLLFGIMDSISGYSTNNSYYAALLKMFVAILFFMSMLYADTKIKIVMMNNKKE